MEHGTEHSSEHHETSAFKLLPGEEILRIKKYPRTMAKLQKPSSLREIYRLTSSLSDAEVGLKGPAVAALPHENTDEDSEHQGLYKVVFGRDSLRVAIDLAEYYPVLAEQTILRLAELQGIEFHQAREEEPGRIVHEARDATDPHALKLTRERGWQWPYYGSVDATPEYVRTVSRYCKLNHGSHVEFLLSRYHDRSGRERTIADSLRAATDWIIRRLEANTEHILEFKTTLPMEPGSALPKGTENQVWKDSWDAYHHSDGSLANVNQPVSSIEVQVTTYDALLDAAELFDTVLDDHSYAAKLSEHAKILERTIHDLYWTDDKGGYYVLGTDRADDGAIRQLKIRTSNMGHVLNSRLLEGDDPEKIRRRHAIFRQLSSDEMLARSGIRTLATDEVRYREGAYHNGSVWIWDTHHIAKGLRRHEEPAFKAFADELDDRILHIVDEIGGFPEYVRGSATDVSVNEYSVELIDHNHADRINKVEQPPQEVQAWTVAAILATNRRREKRRASPDRASE